MRNQQTDRQFKAQETLPRPPGEPSAGEPISWANLVPFGRLMIALCFCRSLVLAAAAVAAPKATTLIKAFLGRQ